MEYEVGEVGRSLILKDCMSLAEKFGFYPNKNGENFNCRGDKIGYTSHKDPSRVGAENNVRGKRLEVWRSAGIIE